MLSPYTGAGHSGAKAGRVVGDVIEGGCFPLTHDFRFQVAVLIAGWRGVGNAAQAA